MHTLSSPFYEMPVFEPKFEPGTLIVEHDILENVRWSEIVAAFNAHISADPLLLNARDGYRSMGGVRLKKTTTGEIYSYHCCCEIKRCYYIGTNAERTETQIYFE